LSSLRRPSLQSTTIILCIVKPLSISIVFNLAHPGPILQDGPPRNLNFLTKNPTSASPLTWWFNCSDGRYTVRSEENPQKHTSFWCTLKTRTYDSYWLEPNFPPWSPPALLPPLEPLRGIPLFNSWTTGKGLELPPPAVSFLILLQENKGPFLPYSPLLVSQPGAYNDFPSAYAFLFYFFFYTSPIFNWYPSFLLIPHIPLFLLSKTTRPRVVSHFPVFRPSLCLIADTYTP